MSRIGRKVLPLPKGVTLSQKPGSVSVTTRSTLIGNSTPIVSPWYEVRSSVIPSFR